jgi:hypothetical protein
MYKILPFFAVHFFFPRKVSLFLKNTLMQRTPLPTSQKEAPRLQLHFLLFLNFIVEFDEIAFFKQVLEFFSKLNVAVGCRKTIYTLQRVFVNNIVYSYWLRMKKKIIGTLVAKGKPICISADGQYDSPGHNAAYLFHR